ncbi:amidohydrolase [Petrotoga sp. HWH.PT.55.6.1]|jgi:N-acetyldiaminopimelate deacetylase|uniref:amidohydrolase n=1 Tax=unclassified Petrotoga TaxID=2620614 RepID=UPI000CA05758|nr:MULTISPECIES: amidohydrolase [unclassified Petrotoga]PNR93580.1 amidohydrolase [Petrotoga sp. HWHPT.55.6.3]RPD36208.1 amidohydrolase [Petrotoga sp. HWH.PT.55.6.1]
MIIPPYELRHKIHENPELSLEEYQTTELLEKTIKEAATFYNVDINVYKPLKTGLIVEYNGGSGEEYLLFRADIDALNIKEKTKVDFKSKNEYMHACGHDVHTAILYGFFLNVIKNKVNKNIVFLFQPAEESKGGAQRVIESGILDKYNIKAAFALHVNDEFPVGTIASTRGTLFASALEFFVDFEGVSSHLAFPHQSKNALNALRIFLDVLDKLPKNPMEPFVIGVGKVSAGSAINILPGNSHVEGSIRGVDSENSLKYFEDMKNILSGIKTMTGVDYSLSKGSFYSEVVNDSLLYDKFISKLSKTFNFVDCGLKMTGEDFGFISKKYPALMCWLGSSKGEHHGLHNPEFLPPDEVIDVGIKVFETFLD